MQNNVLKFETDQPQVIKLKYRTGKEFNRNGYRGFTYTTVSGLLAFFPPEADKEIQALHLDAGQPIRITKKSSGAWDIERVAGDHQLPAGTTDRPHVPSEGALLNQNHTTNGSAPPLTTRESQAFYRQLVASIEAAKSAQEHAARIGYPVTFSSEDIRALAISGFIQQAREGY